jgi:hypothetical protein
MGDARRRFAFPGPAVALVGRSEWGGTGLRRTSITGAWPSETQGGRIDTGTGPEYKM